MPNSRKPTRLWKRCVCQFPLRIPANLTSWPSQLIDASKAWRDAWTDILKYQSNLTHELEVIYQPIVAHSKDADFQPSHVPAETPRLQMQRVSNLVAQYSELKNDMLEEVKAMDDRIIRPAQDARVSIAPMKKTIKKREDRKVCAVARVRQRKALIEAL